MSIYTVVTNHSINLRVETDVGRVTFGSVVDSGGGCCSSVEFCGEFEDSEAVLLLLFWRLFSRSALFDKPKDNKNESVLNPMELIARKYYYR